MISLRLAIESIVACRRNSSVEFRHQRLVNVGVQDGERHVSTHNEGAHGTKDDTGPGPDMPKSDSSHDCRGHHARNTLDPMTLSGQFHTTQ